MRLCMYRHPLGCFFNRQLSVKELSMLQKYFLFYFNILKCNTRYIQLGFINWQVGVESTMHLRGKALYLVLFLNVRVCRDVTDGRPSHQACADAGGGHPGEGSLTCTAPAAPRCGPCNHSPLCSRSEGNTQRANTPFVFISLF